MIQLPVRTEQTDTFFRSKSSRRAQEGNEQINAELGRRINKLRPPYAQRRKEGRGREGGGAGGRATERERERERRGGETDPKALKGKGVDTLFSGL
jgi:hypothetical protein